jgi:hypothetical protein
MAQPGWYPFADGSTLGQMGTENGTILRDEEHGEGARITLERDGSTPFAITCGISDWMVHTGFYQTEEEARRAFDAIQVELVRILSRIPRHDDPEARAKLSMAQSAVETFMGLHP